MFAFEPNSDGFGSNGILTPSGKSLRVASTKSAVDISEFLPSSSASLSRTAVNLYDISRGLVFFFSFSHLLLLFFGSIFCYLFFSSDLEYSLHHVSKYCVSCYICFYGTAELPKAIEQ